MLIDNVIGAVSKVIEKVISGRIGQSLSVARVAIVRVGRANLYQVSHVAMPGVTTSSEHCPVFTVIHLLKEDKNVSL